MSLILFALDEQTDLGLGYTYPLTVTLDVATIVAGDTFPYVTGTVTDAAGTEVDLADPNLLEIVFVAAKANDGTIIASGLASVLDGAGRFAYHPLASDFRYAWPKAVVQLQLVYQAGRQCVPSNTLATLAVQRPLDFTP